MALVWFHGWLPAATAPGDRHWMEIMGARPGYPERSQGVLAMGTIIPPQELRPSPRLSVPICAVGTRTTCPQGSYDRGQERCHGKCGLLGKWCFGM